MPLGLKALLELGAARKRLEGVSSWVGDLNAPAAWSLLIPLLGKRRWASSSASRFRGVSGAAEEMTPNPGI